MLNVGYDIGGKHDVSLVGISGSEDVENSVSVGGEIYIPQKNYEWGLGVEYQIPREQKNIEGSFSFIPIYSVGRFFLQKQNSEENRGFILFTRVGYNLFNGEKEYKGSASLDGGIYYAGGIGFVANNKLSFNVIYEVLNGTFDILNYKGDIDYSKFSICLGYRL